MEKFKMYTLYAKIYGSNNSMYTIEESLRNDKKRQQPLMYGNLIEKLDRLTAKYDSIEDLLESYPEEVYGGKIRLYEPVIIVDKHETDRSKSYELYDIVFKPDAIELEDRENLRTWLLDYLKNNPNDIAKFRGIKDIYKNLMNKYPGMDIIKLVDITVKIYFEEDNYKRYREVYFKLKELDPKRVKNNDIYR